MALTQARRLIAVSSPLGKELLLFRRMTATEALSRLFEFQLDLLSENSGIKLEEVLGQRLTIRLELPSGEFRYFNGCVSRFCQVGTDGRYAVYEATLRPWLWFLTRTADCRIFQEKTVPDIIKAIFREHGFTDFEEALSASYRQWEYCVQYRETDFNFVSRLMEQEGIYYYFKHEDGKHTLVLSDSYSAHNTLPGYEKIPYFPPDEHDRRERDHIFDWRLVQDLQPVTYALNDFDFKMPSKKLRSSAAVERQHAEARYEIYDYPGAYVESANGDDYARIRIEELQAQYETVQGHGNARGLAVGALFELMNYPREDQNREYLIVSAAHELRSNEYESDRAGGTPDTNYACRFNAMEARQPFRPLRTTPKPIVQGPQTAIVVGKAGEEIWTDKYGRVKVQFHWDRYGKNDENSSCWVRVSHPWAGKNWGAVSIPRIGQEVIVDFLEGDPDQPIITGRVYNGEQMPPYGLPAGGVVSGIKSNTHKGKGYNEMSMDDTAGKEKITIHGQYDMNTTVEHDQTNTVNHDFTETIKKNAKIEITEGTYNHDVKANTATYHVQGALTEKYDTTQDTTVKGNITIKSTAGEILIEAKNKITLHTGSSKIEMDQSGLIKISGKNIFIHGDVDAKVDAPKVAVTAGDEAKIGCGNQNSTFDKQKTAHSGAAINSSAVGMHEITGAVVKIN